MEAPVASEGGGRPDGRCAQAPVVAQGAGARPGPGHAVDLDFTAVFFDFDGHCGPGARPALNRVELKSVVLETALLHIESSARQLPLACGSSTFLAAAAQGQVRERRACGADIGEPFLAVELDGPLVAFSPDPLRSPRLQPRLTVYRPVGTRVTEIFPSLPRSASIVVLDTVAGAV